MTEDRIFEPGQMRMGPERQMQRDEPQTQQEMLMQANYADGVQCPNCGTINEPEAQFCASCGQPLRMAMCPNCGSEIDPDADFWILDIKAQYPDLEMILHTDQGSVYSSKNFNELLPLFNIVHSMSRAGTPTDNAAMEAINGWMKAEMFSDLHITSNESIDKEIDKYIVFFNEERPAYSLNYLTPKQYKELYT